jgi:hydrogenase maturation protease
MRVRVIGLGNVLMRDDAFGPYVVRVLDAFYVMTPEVELIDVGTPGLDLIPYVCGVDVLVIVDTVRADGAPGDIRVFRTADILADAVQPRLGPHDPGVKEALLTAAVTGSAPREVLLVGVIPQAVEPGVELSPAVRSSLAPVVGWIVTELTSRGAGPLLRAEPRVPETWWERPAADRPPTNFPSPAEFSRVARGIA